jgi:hypothetical protein
MLKCIFSVSYSILKCSRIFIVCPGKTALLLVVRVPVDTMNDKIPSVFRTTDGQENSSSRIAKAAIIKEI